MEVREAHPEEARIVDSDRRPADDELQALGLKPADSAHLADAVGLDASHFLTFDKGILKRAAAIENKWGLRVRTPVEFLLESVRAGAPWPTTVPGHGNPARSARSARRPHLGHIPSGRVKTPGLARHRARRRTSMPPPKRLQILRTTWCYRRKALAPPRRRWSRAVVTRRNPPHSARHPAHLRPEAAS